MTQAGVIEEIDDSLEFGYTVFDSTDSETEDMQFDDCVEPEPAPQINENKIDSIPAMNLTCAKKF